MQEATQSFDSLVWAMLMDKLPFRHYLPGHYPQLDWTGMLKLDWHGAGGINGPALVLVRSLGYQFN